MRAGLVDRAGLTRLVVLVGLTALVDVAEPVEVMGLAARLARVERVGWASPAAGAVRDLWRGVVMQEG